MFDVSGGTGELGELVDRCRKAARFDVGLGSNDDLRAAVLELESARAAIDATQGHYLAELEARDACDIDLGLSTVSWLCSELRVPRRDAAVRVRVANKLRTELDGVDAALGEGRIGFEHARVLAAANPRVAEVIAGVQDALVAAAQHSPFEIWRRDVAGLVELVDQDGGHDPNDDVSRNRLHLDDVGGATVLRGELVGETALVVEQALEAATDALFRRYRRDHEACPELVIPPRSVVRALALAELVRHGLVENATAGPVVDVTVVLDGDTGAVTTPNGTRVDPHTCGHLLCDPVLHALWRDGPSVPLDLKREVRFATPHQRRVLSVRDGGCVFPGCGARASWCDAHHLEYWEDGGHTDMTNLALLCRHHHGVVHRKGWSMTADPAGGFTFTTPAGRMLTSRRPDPP